MKNHLNISRNANELSTINNLKSTLIKFIKEDTVLFIALLLGFISSLVSFPKIEYIDFKVLLLLFNLMIVVAGFNELNVLDTIALSLLKKCSNTKTIYFALTFITFFSAMIVTNDVALITFVPLTIIVGKKANIKTLTLVVVQTLAANLGSSLTPMGNPQNLFIYSFYNISPMVFFKTISPIIALSIIFLSILILKDKKISLNINLDSVKIKDKKSAVCFSLLFTIILLSVFHIVDYRLTFVITLIAVFILNKKLFISIDYSLLLTFIGFFTFVGNISTLDFIKNFMSNILNSKLSTLLSSIFVSQFISNVPATMLLSGFTNHYKELLLGVNIGGMGTLIASMASVISYKIYVKEYPSENKTYMKIFSLYNVIGLIIFISFTLLLI